jgi:protein-glutamine gamma-glutamyltransferase
MTAQATDRTLSPPIALLQMQTLALLLGACLLAHATWMSTALTGLLAAVIALRVWWHVSFPQPVPLLIRAPLLLLTLIAVFSTTGSPTGRDGGAALLMSLAVLKLVEARTVRDGRMLVASVFFIAMTEFLFSQSLPITFYVGAVSVGAFMCLTLLRKHQMPDASALSLRITVTRAFIAVGRITLAALPMAAAAFLFFPRLGEPLWGAPWQGAEGRTGITDEMRPGMLSKLWSDDTPVFRVSFEGRVPEMKDLYWRGPVLWSFDKGTWARARWMGTTDILPLRYRIESIVRYEVLLEATEMQWYFPLDLPLRAAPGSRLIIDGQMVADKPIIAPKRLNLESATEFVYEAKPIPGHRWAALRLPNDSNPRAMALASQWRAQGMTDQQVIDAALKMFNESFMYSLEPPPLTAESSVDEFLFDTQIGYCEHFSSSFAFLMRAAGIPTRVVTGYQGGYWNSSGGYLVVRNSDAHAWTEVWLQGLGWVRTDPTSAVAPERILRGSNANSMPAASRWYHDGWVSSWLDRVDSVSRWWRRRIVDFDALKQQQLLVPFGVEQSELRHLVMALAVAGTLALVFGAWWAMRGQGGHVRDPLLRAWRTFCRTLEKAGVRRESSEGPIQFSQRASQALPHNAGIIVDLGREFAHLRYASTGNTDPAARELLIRRLRRFRTKARA